MTSDPFLDARDEDDPYVRVKGHLSPAWLREEAAEFDREEMEAADERVPPAWVKAGLLARRGLSETGRPI